MRDIDLRTGLEGLCMGIILCAWVSGSSSDAVWMIRLPATIFLAGSVFVDIFQMIRLWRKP